jgi:uncharacterized protein YbjT (DUF2867 family)
MKKIAIVGATGMAGQPVAKEFIKAGFEVTLLARDIDKTKKIFGSGIRIIEGDLNNTESIKEFLLNQDGLYLSLSVPETSSVNDFQPERDGIKNILSISKDAGIKRIGYLSSLYHLYEGQNRFSWWHFKIKGDAVKQIKSQKIPYSVFYPSTFMESFDKKGFIQGNNINLAGVSRFPMYLIAASDYGKQVVRAFEINSGNNEYVVQGQEGFTADKAAELLVKNYSKRKLKIVRLPFGVLKFFGLLSKKFSYVANTVNALNNYPEKFEAEKTWKELGTPQTKFIDYIKSL